MPETIRLSVIATLGTRPPAHGFESHPRHANKTTPLRKIDPAKWPSPRGYSHAVAGTGTFVFVGGQIATDNAGRVKGSVADRSVTEFVLRLRHAPEVHDV